jgi:branched-subunit amino acid transport protein
MDSLSLWMILILGGLGTYLIRLSFILIFQHIQIPDYMERILRLVPPSVFLAIALPELLIRDGAVNFSFSNLRLLAGMLAVLVAIKSRNVLVTIAAGMAFLWILQYFLPAVH